MKLCKQCNRELWRIHPQITAMDLAVIDGFADDAGEKAKFLVEVWNGLRLELNCIFMSDCSDGPDEQE